MKPVSAWPTLRSLLLPLVLLGAGACASGRSLTPAAADLALVDDAAAARTALEEARTAVRIASGDPIASRVERLVHLGLFTDADSLLASYAGARTADLALAEASLRLAQYRIDDARSLVDGVLAVDAGHRRALALSLTLARRTGDEVTARAIAEDLLRRGAHDLPGAAAAAALGWEALRAGEADLALEWAARVRSARRPVVEGWTLEASARAWLGDDEGEEAALRGALAMDPFFADARYLYGLAAWRRSGAGGAAAAGEHWWLALQADPLHLPTHLLLGSVCGLRVPTPAWVSRAADASGGGVATGEPAATPVAPHTDLPPPAEEAIRRGAAYYSAAAENPATLDSALAAFGTAAAIAPGDLRAHRGIAAVLRERQASALHGADSLRALRAAWPDRDDGPLTVVIPALADPALQSAAGALSWRLADLSGFLPLLARLGTRVHLTGPGGSPAAVDGSPALPAHTLLGHCGWTEGPDRLATASIDDIRTESLEPHRVVHLLVHLLHDGVLSEPQRRRLRSLYRVAVEERRHLTAMSETDEVEYLATGVEAYRNAAAQPGGVGPPLTRIGLLRRDPELYRFIEQWLSDGAAAAAGDPRLLRSNLAEVYTQLARERRLAAGAGRSGAEQATILLDSALVHDGSYRPAVLEYVRAQMALGRPDRAEEWLRVAEGLGADDPATLATRAELLGGSPSHALGGHEARAALLSRAISLEDDPVARIGYRARLRELHRSAGRLPEAVGSVVETLREETGRTPRERSLLLAAEAAMMRMWLEAGHDDESVRFFGERVAADPLDSRSRALFVDALLMSSDTAAARDALDDGIRLLDLAGAAHPSLLLRHAELTMAGGEREAAQARVEPLLDAAAPLPPAEALRLVRLLISGGMSTEAQRQLARMQDSPGDAEQGDVLFTRARIMEWRGDDREAERYYRDAVRLDPYDVTIRAGLHDFLWERGRLGEAAEVVTAAGSLEIQPGPGLERQLKR